MMSSASYPYACDIKLTFPSPKQAEIATRVMQVDEEIGNRVKKSVSVDTDDPKNLIA